MALPRFTKFFSPSRFLILPLALFSFHASSSQASVIIADSFSGAEGATLDGALAPTFDGAISSAGGSAAWVANSAYKANGELAGTAVGITTQSSSAVLNLGSYIWDSRGTENGYFTLTATISGITGGEDSSVNRWVALGFFNRQPELTQAFYSASGVANAVHRQNDTSGNNYFSGPGATTSSSNPNPGVLSGTITFSISIDLRTWDPDSDQFGTVIFANSLTTGTSTMDLPDVRSAVDPYGFVGFSGNTWMEGQAPNQTAGAGPVAFLSDFSLTQIPEPGALLLAPAGLAFLTLRRRGLM